MFGYGTIELQKRVPAWGNSETLVYKNVSTDRDHFIHGILHGMSFSYQKGDLFYCISMLTLWDRDDQHYRIEAGLCHHQMEGIDPKKAVAILRQAHAHIFDVWAERPNPEAIKLIQDHRKVEINPYLRARISDPKKPPPPNLV